MILELMNESFSGFSGYSSVETPEPSNEGFEYEYGGYSRALSLAESAMHSFRMTNMFIESKEVQCMSESAGIADGERARIAQLSENFISTGIAKIKEFLVKLWKNIKEVFQSIYTSFAKMFNKNGFLKTAKEQLENVIDFKGLEFEGFTFTIGDVEPQKMYEGMQSEIDGLTKTALSELQKISGNGAGKTATEVATAAKETNTALSNLEGDKLTKALAQKAMGCSYNDLEKNIKKKLRGNKDTKAKITFDKNGAFKAIEDLSSLESDVKQTESQVDTMFKEAIDTVDKNIEDAKKNNDQMKDGTEAYNKLHIKILTTQSAALQKAVSIANFACKLKIDAYREQASQSMNIIHAAIKQNKKNVKEANKKLNASTDLVSNIMEQFM